MFSLSYPVIVPATPQIRSNVSLAPLTTFGIGGPARSFLTAVTEDDVAAAVTYASEHGLPLFVLGGGSNLLVRDAGFDGLVLHIAIPGVTTTPAGMLEAGAGVSWDGLVDHAVGLDLAGIECLAGIPGSVGGAPVQNIGAYGQEVAETILAVRAYDRQQSRFVDLAPADCRFRYRESIFNTGQAGRYIVTRVRFQLTPNGAPNLRYADLQRRFAAAPVPPTLAEVAAAVREVRRGKGMLLVPDDPNCRSAGSFFKNPIVSPAMLDHVAASSGVAVADVPHWPAESGQIKLPAAWLLERAGFVKGYRQGNAGISGRHTLAIVNLGNATCVEVERLQDQISLTVAERFGIHLQREPVLLG